MSKDDDSLIDKNGIIYVRGWDGRYRPKHGIFGPERDVGIMGRPRAEIDFMGDLLIARDSWGNPIHSSDGDQLYRRTGSRNPGAGDPISDLLANSGEHGFAVVFILLLVLSVVLGYVGIILVGAITLIGPMVFGGWLFIRGWAKQPKLLRWLWALSWLVAGYIVGLLETNRVFASILGNYAWLVYAYYAIGLIAIAGVVIGGVAGKRDKEETGISPALQPGTPQHTEQVGDQIRPPTEALVESEAIAAPTEVETHKVITLTSPIPQGGTARFKISTSPGTSCSLSYTTPSGIESKARGLGAITADNTGVCSWSWEIAYSTTPGTGQLILSVGGRAHHYNIVIQ